MGNINFKDYYLFPLQLNFGVCHTDDGERAFDFYSKYYSGDGYTVCKETKQEIIDIINGDDNKKLDIHDLTYDSSYVYAGGIWLISIRGWGHLTGTGGLNLDTELASKIQDAFGEYILERLKASTNVINNENK